MEAGGDAGSVRRSQRWVQQREIRAGHNHRAARGITGATQLLYWRAEVDGEMTAMRKLLLAMSMVALCTALGLAAGPTYSDFLKVFQYRNLGPWRTGAWVTSLAVPET